jgi:hypothetical protein
MPAASSGATTASTAAASTAGDSDARPATSATVPPYSGNRRAVVTVNPARASMPIMTGVE